MSSINFDNPWLLLIAVPLIILVAVPFVLAIRKDNVNGHNVASGIIHVFMAIIIAFAAAGTSVITTVTRTDVYVLADVSYSSSLNLDTVDDYIRELSGNLPANSEMGVICFANGQRIVTHLGDKFTTVRNSGVDESSTNIVGALSYAGALFNDDVIKRIVLITDGKATDGSDDDALRRQINSLAERNIHVDAIFVDNNIDGDAIEVQMSGAEFSSSVSLGRSEKVNLTVQANCPDGETVDATVKLYKDGDLYKTTAHSLKKGKNDIAFALDTATEGAHDYTAKIESEIDFNARNNEISFTQVVSGKTSVLLITDDYADDTRIKQIYADKIAAGSVKVTSFVGRTDIPVTIEELCEYDEIIISDFDVSTIENCALFLDNLDTVVSLYGKSLLTFGDTHIQGRADDALSSLSDMLPVVYGKTADAPKLYTILIDTSRSMEQLNKLENAKSAAKQIVGMLSAGDELNVIEFNGDATPVLLGYDIESGKEAVMQKIDSLDIRQGTVMSAGLKLAHEQMKEGVYSEKRLVVISDGLDWGGDDVIGEIKSMRADDINTIVLDTGRGGSTDANANQAKQLLVEMAQFGNDGGTPFDISTEEDLKDVIEGELSQDVSGYVGGASYVAINRRKDETLNGIDENDVKNSYVRGFIKSSAKPNANTVLNVSYEYSIAGTDDSSSVSVPLYAYWQYGNGRAASFTSSLSGAWINSMSSELSGALFKNAFDTAIPTEKTDYPFLFNVEKNAGSATISLTPTNYRNDGWAEYEITAPDGEVKQGTMSFGSLSYGSSFVTTTEGKYTVTVKYGYGNGLYEKEVTKYFNVSYSSEYDSFAIYDASALIKGVGANGKVSTNGKLVLENDEKEIGKYYLSLSMPLLAACVALYAVDIAVRKLKLEDIKSLFGRGKK